MSLLDVVTVIHIINVLVWPGAGGADPPRWRIHHMSHSSRVGRDMFASDRLFLRGSPAIGPPLQTPHDSPPPLVSSTNFSQSAVGKPGSGGGRSGGAQSVLWGGRWGPNSCLASASVRMWSGVESGLERNPRGRRHGGGKWRL